MLRLLRRSALQFFAAIGARSGSGSGSSSGSCPGCGCGLKGEGRRTKSYRHYTNSVYLSVGLVSYSPEALLVSFSTSSTKMTLSASLSPWYSSQSFHPSFTIGATWAARGFRQASLFFLFLALASAVSTADVANCIMNAVSWLRFGPRQLGRPLGRPTGSGRCAVMSSGSLRRDWRLTRCWHRVQV